jgi:hypothetical protein
MSGALRAGAVTSLSAIARRYQRSRHRAGGRCARPGSKSRVVCPSVYLCGMTYHSRIPVDPSYAQALGQAFYNFTYLEWGVIWTIVKLSDDGFDSVPTGKSASWIGAAFIGAIAKASPPLSEPLRKSLVKLHEKYLSAIKVRNKLLHGHPYTAPDGSQQIGGGGHEWTVEKVNDAAKLFEDIAIEGNTIFHDRLKSERPQ